jgi:NAD(P)-dependent dehydrogenase (short-subunit alcohol dehydrogenase family)
MSALTDFDGRRVLVTGGSRGIGRELAHLLATRGATVVVVARSERDVGHCVAGLPGDGHRGVALDVGSEQAWRDAVADGVLEPLDGLVTAAAVLGPVGPIGSYTPQEFWQTMRVNVLGTLMAVSSCLGPLETTRGAIVALAGGGATSPQPRYDAYASSKAAVARLAENLAFELGPRGVRINAVSPGFVATEIHAATLQAGPELAGAAYFADTERQLRDGAVPALRAAELTAFLLSAAAEGIEGRLISAPWDPWEEPAFQRRLRELPDLARVRRIDEQRYTSRTETGQIALEATGAGLVS